MNKRRKVDSKRALALEELNWTKTSLEDEDVFAQDGIILDFEEIDDVEIRYSESQGKKTATFLVPSDTQAADQEEEWHPASSPEISDSEATPIIKKTAARSSIQLGRLDDTPFREPAEIKRSNLHSALKWALARSGFQRPTQIQAATWKVAIDKTGSITQRDIVGVAETGSGKTLAYGLPMIQSAINNLEAEHALTSLVLCPTRELALQVVRHLSEIIQQCLVPLAVVEQPVATSNGKKRKQTSDTPFQFAPINVVALTGGISIHKQKRQLMSAHAKPDIIVATPGRLWELAQDDDVGLGGQIKRLKFLVLDEADRMVEAGHYAELEYIFALTNRRKKAPQYQNDFDAADAKKQDGRNDNLCTYVFSATMSKDLQRNLKLPAHKRRKATDQDTLSALDELLHRLDFRDPDPLVIDLQPHGGTAANLTECHLDCLSTDKDVLLYYFLLRYPGKSLVFLSSIDGIRRLKSILDVLQIGQISAIHSNMEQKARLRAMERFHSAKGSSILLATDVAARGLDVQDIDHVVHFQLPRSADMYVHRSGRTARAGKSGISLALISPEEKVVETQILKALQKDRKAMMDLPIEWSIVEDLRKRVELAKGIDKAQHQATKENHDISWLKDTADALDLDLDAMSSDDERRTMKHKGTAKVASLKAELAYELQKPLRRAGISSKYITSGMASHLVKAVLSDQQHDKIIGLKSSTAEEDVHQAGRKTKAQPKRLPKGKR